MKGVVMAVLDDIREKAEAAMDQAKPFVDGAVKAGADFAEKADEWARSEHPHAEGAFEAVSGAASGAIDAMTDGANAAFEFIKDRVEEVSGKDVDGDGQVGRYRTEDVEAGKELVMEEVTSKVNKAAEKVASITPEDVKAGAELAAEAVANKVGDLKAGAELAAEAFEDAINKPGK